MTDPNGDDGLIHHYKSDAFTKTMLSVVSGAMVLGVAGIWSMSTHLAALDERLAQWSVSVQAQITALTRQDTILQDQINAAAVRARENEQSIYRNNARIDALERVHPK